LLFLFRVHFFSISPVFTHENIASIVRYLRDGFFTNKKTAERVPELERQVDVLEKNQTTPKQQQFAKLPLNIQDTILQQGQQMIEQVRLAQLQAIADEKECMQSLHKTKKWSELTPDERKEVRRLLVNSPEFSNRQDYLDFKRAFGAFVERGR